MENEANEVNKGTKEERIKLALTSRVIDELREMADKLEHGEKVYGVKFLVGDINLLQE
jgi:hypothetical protein